MTTNEYRRAQSEFRKAAGPSAPAERGDLDRESQALADEIEPTAAEVARWAEDYATLNDAVNGSNKLIEPLKKALKGWLREHPRERVYVEGKGHLGLKPGASRTYWDCKALAEHEPQLLLELASHGCVTLDTGLVKKLQGMGVIPMLTAEHHRAGERVYSYQGQVDDSLSWEESK